MKENNGLFNNLFGFLVILVILVILILSWKDGYNKGWNDGVGDATWIYRGDLESCQEEIKLCENNHRYFLDKTASEINYYKNKYIECWKKIQPVNIAKCPEDMEEKEIKQSDGTIRLQCVTENE